MCMFIQTRAKLRAGQGLALFWYSPSSLSTKASSLRSCRRRKSTVKESRQCLGAAQTPALFCACPTPFPSLPLAFLQRSRSRTVCLQKPEHTVQNSSLAWAGAAGWALGLIWAIGQFCPDSINMHLPASCVRRRIPPHLEPDVRPVMSTHSCMSPPCRCGPSWNSQIWRN